MVGARQANHFFELVNFLMSHKVKPTIRTEWDSTTVVTALVVWTSLVMKTRRRETMEQNNLLGVSQKAGIPADSLRLRVDFFHQSTISPLSMVTP